MNRGRRTASWLTVLTMSVPSLAASSAPAAPSLSPSVARSVRNDVSLPLSALAALASDERPAAIVDADLPTEPRALAAGIDADPVVQDAHADLAMPAPSISFDGIDNRNGVLPPDTNGDVGPHHYMQWVNLSLAVWDKAGTLLLGPVNGNTLFTGFGGPCETTNSGDPIVLYDAMADRWMASQFSLPGGASGPFYQCIAVSTTGDPTGSWFRYAFVYSTSKLNDYPKFGVWPDAYYMSVNQFNAGSLTFAGAGAAAFDRTAMLAGLPATMISFDLAGTAPDVFGMLPADLDGSTLPPGDAPNVFTNFFDDAWGYPSDLLSFREFRVDFSNPSASTFTISGELATAPFDWFIACGGARQCIPQPSTTRKLDAISSRLMYRAAYRNFGSRDALVLNHTVDAGVNHAGIRWYEIRDPLTAARSIYQQSTFAPDTAHRWMGSAAMDRDGNIALGYSVSSASIFPSIRYAGRLAPDPLGSLQAEATLQSGSGSQTHSAGRWGDYSSMSVDPVDDCTFWYTTEYLVTTGSAPWRTRIGAFRFPSCGAPETQITSGPSGLTGSTAATFEFVASASGSTFRCSLDGETSSACTSPLTYPSLSQGSHTFSVAAARDGLVDPTPATRSWIVDTVPPDTRVLTGPSGDVASTDATITFDATEAGSTFLCALDGGPEEGCASPRALSALSEGEHHFTVRAVDAVGNQDPTPAERRWVVDTTAPGTTIVDGPPAFTASREATFTFVATESRATFTCSLDEAPFGSCVSPAAVADLEPGAHSFAVRAVDAAGNLDPTPAEVAWTVDLAPPEVALVSPAEGGVYVEDVRIVAGAPMTAVVGQITLVAEAIDATSGVARVSFSIDGARVPDAAIEADPNGRTFRYRWRAPGIPGQHLIEVTAHDRVGHSGRAERNVLALGLA